MLIAFWASTWLVISTNPKPFDVPVSRSVITAADTTVPACANNVRSSSSVVVYDRFPTYNLASMTNSPLMSGRGRDEHVARVEASAQPERSLLSTIVADLTLLVARCKECQ